MNAKCTKAAVLKAFLSGYCNTAQDVADEIDVTVKRATCCICALVRDGVLKGTDRSLPNSNPDRRGRRLRVFEVTA